MPVDLWSDVRRDPAATDELVRELAATAAAVGEVLAVVEADGPVIAEDWGGPHRDVFDADRARLAASARELVDALLAAAGGAVELLAAAEGEQRLRERVRHQALAEQACRPGAAC